MSLPFYFISLIILVGSILLLARGFSGGTSYFNRRRLMNQLEDHHERLRNKRKDLLVRTNKNSLNNCLASFLLG